MAMESRAPGRVAAGDATLGSSSIPDPAYPEAFAAVVREIDGRAGSTPSGPAGKDRRARTGRLAREVRPG
jgi:hypothetical protein